MLPSEGLRNELVISKNVAGAEPPERVTELEWVFPVVEPEGELVQVRREMLDAELVVRADDRPIQKTPDGFDGVGMNITPNPFLLAVADRFVDRVLVSDAVITGVGVGVDRYGFVGNVRTDEIVEDVGGCVGAVGDAEADVPATLDGSENHRLVGPALRFGPLPPEVGFVNFDSAEKLGAVLFHSGSYAVAEVPGGLVGDADSSTELVGAHALLGFDHQEHSQEPFPQGKLGVLEDGSDSDGELVSAIVAFHLATSLDMGDGLAVASWASDTASPPNMLQIGVALVFGAELFDQIGKVH